MRLFLCANPDDLRAASRLAFAAAGTIPRAYTLGFARNGRLCATFHVIQKDKDKKAQA